MRLRFPPNRGGMLLALLAVMARFGVTPMATRRAVAVLLVLLGAGVACSDSDYAESVRGVGGDGGSDLVLDSGADEVETPSAGSEGAVNGEALFASALPLAPLDTITVGERNACGVIVGGSVLCWGDDSAGQTWARYGQTSTPAGAFVQVAAGRLNVCGLRADSAMVCWGDSESGLADVPEGRYTGIAAGGAHALTSFRIAEITRFSWISSWSMHLRTTMRGRYQSYERSSAQSRQVDMGGDCRAVGSVW